jgi:hypothetical protein
MKKKYVTVQVLLACLSKPVRKRENVHVLLAMSIAERKRIMRKWDKSFFGNEVDIHTMLQATIAEREEIIRRWKQAFLEEYEIQERNAA